MAAPNPNDSAEQIAEKLKQLNVNAPSFVPNAKAKPFVPSWMNKKTDAAPAGSAPAKVCKYFIIEYATISKYF
jgi:hypothetical protein